MSYPSGPTRPRLAAFLGLLALVASACAGAGAPPTPTSPARSSAVTSATASPEESMMDHGSPSPGAAATAGTGTFHGVVGQASGSVALLHLADGSFAVTFEGFEIASEGGLHVLLVIDRDVTASSQVDPAASLDLGPLTGTSGMLDFKLPAGTAVDVAMGYHAVVLWDPAMQHAEAAAPLKEP